MVDNDHVNHAQSSAQPTRRVDLDADGLTVRDDTWPEGHKAAWHDVVEMAGYVVDIGIEQSLVLDFSLANGESIEVGDHLDGWETAVRDLSDHLPLLVDDLPAALADLTADDGVLIVVRRHANDEVP